MCLNKREAIDAGWRVPKTMYKSAAAAAAAIGREIGQRERLLSHTLGALLGTA
jgi:hypothetical protein